MKVAKFGGSSLASAAQFTKVGAIIKNDPCRKFIVVSAPGKRHDRDVKLTDRLIQLRKEFVHNQLGTIMLRFSDIIKGLHLSPAITIDIEQQIQAVLTSAQPKAAKQEALKSIGEDASARILSA